MPFNPGLPNYSGGTKLSSFDAVTQVTTTGTNFSIFNIGGYKEVWSLNDLIYTIPSGTEGAVRYSGNTIPIEFYTGQTTPFVIPDSIAIESDYISSGRRRLGMLVYVHETNQTYQYRISDYENYFNEASGSTTINDTNGIITISSNTQGGRDFIDLWLDSSIEGISGVTKENARWVIFHDTDTFVTGGTVNYNNTGNLTLTNNDGDDVTISGLTTITGGTYLSGSSTLRLVNNLGDNIDITGIAADTNTFVTGGTYSSGTTTLTLTRNDGYDVVVTGFSASGLVSVSANTGLGIENDVLYTTYNTLLDPTISMAETIGGLDAGTTVADLSGDTFVSLFNDLLFPTVQPTYTIPTISIGGVSNSTVEVGSTLNLSITASATKNTAGDFTQLRILRNGSAILTDTTLTESTASNLPDQYGYSDPNNPNSGFTISPTPYSETYTIPEPTGGNTSTSTYYRVDGNYDAGLPKKDNKGNNDTRTPAVRSTNAPQAASNNFQSVQRTYTGIYPFFWGISETEPTLSSVISAITGGTEGTDYNKELVSASGTISVDYNIPSDEEYFLWVAHFGGYTSKTQWYVAADNKGELSNSGPLDSAVEGTIDSPDSYWNGVTFDIYLGNYATQVETMQFGNNLF